MVIRTVHTDVLIKAQANIEKVPACVNVWFEIGHHTNNTIKYVNVKQPHQAIGSNFCVTFPRFKIIQKGTSGR